MEEMTKQPTNTPKTCAFATWSLILGIASLILSILLIPGILAITFGIIALIQISNNAVLLKGKGKAIAGIIMGGISFILIPIMAIIAAIAIPMLLMTKSERIHHIPKQESQTAVEVTPTLIPEESNYILIQTLDAGDNFTAPFCITMDKQNNFVYIADKNNNCIIKLTSDGQQLVTKWNTQNSPVAITVDSNVDKNFIYVAEIGTGTGVIEKFTTEGQPIKKWSFAGNEAKNINAGGIASWGNYLYLGNSDTNSIQKFTTDGELVKSWGILNLSGEFLDVAVDDTGNVYVANPGSHQVLKFDPEGTLLTKWGKSGNKPGEFSGSGPIQITIGPNNTIYTTENNPPRIQEFTLEGKFISYFGKGDIDMKSISLDIATASDGKIYVVDDAAACIHIFGLKSEKGYQMEPEDEDEKDDEPINNDTDK